MDEINGILEREIRAVLDNQAPVKIVQVRRGYKSWVSSDLKEKMAERDSLRETARRTGDAGDWAQYRRSRNETSKEIKKSRRDIFQFVLKSGGKK